MPRTSSGSSSTRHLAVDPPQHLGDGGRERGIVALDRGGGRELEPEVLLECVRLGAQRDPADAPLGRGDDQHAERAGCHRERDRRAGPARAVRRRRHAQTRVGLLVEPALHVRAAGERQPEQPGHLVEGLAGRVVDGRAQRVDGGGDVLDPQQAGVTATDQQGQARVRQRTVLELVDRHVRGEVVDAVQRLAQPDRERLGRRDTDEQRAGQARAAGDRDGVDVVQPQAGGLAGLLDGRDHRLEVGTARHLRYDAAEPRVLVDAARHRVRQQRVAADQTDAGLVARGLDAEDERFGHFSILTGCSRTTALAPSR